MSEIFNCWQCEHYNHMISLCKKYSISCGAFDAICENFVFKKEDAKQQLNNAHGGFTYCNPENQKVDPGKGTVLRYIDTDVKITKKQESASDRIALIAKEIEWLRLDPGCHDRMVYDSLSTIETMLKHLSTSIKGTERDFMMEVVASE